jgi:2-amino-4-hydroxy-6-hydroxymethyldihydropteridine diphosphokinase
MTASAQASAAHEAFVALGGNLGNREATLQEALRRLNASPGVTVRRVSAVYETAPVGLTDQPAFLNMAAAVETTLDPLSLLRKLLDIELAMGRVREIRWGPRNIDLDLLLYSGVTMDAEELTLPHPRMGERAFVLVPLRDVWPDACFPWDEAINRMPVEQEGIRRRDDLVVLLG